MIRMGLFFVAIGVVSGVWEYLRDGTFWSGTGFVLGGAVGAVYGVCLGRSPRPRVGRWIVGLGLGSVVAQLVYGAVDAARQARSAMEFSPYGVIAGLVVAVLGACLVRFPRSDVDSDGVD